MHLLFESNELKLNLKIISLQVKSISQPQYFVKGESTEKVT
jgi:hypothetical protein